MDSDPSLSANAQTLLATLGATGRAVRLARQAGGMAELRLQRERHVEETEEQLFPSLVMQDGSSAGLPTSPAQSGQGVRRFSGSVRNVTCGMMGGQLAPTSFHSGVLFFLVAQAWRRLLVS